MDTQRLAFDVLEKAYKDINTCNKLLGGETITLRAVWQLIKAFPKETYTILDVGCGDGSMMRKLSAFLHRRGISHKIIGVDLKQDLLEIATQKSKNFPALSFQQSDILEADASLSCDIVINTLTLHHFEEEKMEIFLNKLVHLAQVGVVVNDLQRSKWAYQLFRLFSFFLLKTSVATHDGLVSISKGFKKRELVALSKKIPNTLHTIQWKWAFRYVWVMKTNNLITSNKDKRQSYEL